MPEEFVDVVIGAFVVVCGDCWGGCEAKVDDEDVGRGGVDEEVSWVEIVVDDLDQNKGQWAIGVNKSSSMDGGTVLLFRGGLRGRR